MAKARSTIRWQHPGLLHGHRASREAGIVGIIVEHAFLSNKSDSDKLKSEAFLKELGYADAEA